jgi:hypothetical protein
MVGGKQSGVLSTVLISAVLCGMAWYLWPLRFTKGDAIGQFFPVSLEGYRLVKSGGFPFFNFFQFLGHPILEVGYYPVLYPIFLLSCFLAEYALGDIQQSWNLLCVFQIILTSVGGLLFCRVFLGIEGPLAIAAGISLGFIGCGIFFSDWFYGLVCQAFVPLLLVGLWLLLTSPTWPRALVVALVASCFVFSSNVQLLFYAGHFILLGGIAGVCRLALHEGPGVIIRRSGFFLAMSAVACLFITFPFLLGLFQHAANTTRELAAVSPEKFFWETNDAGNTWRYSWIPVAGNEAAFWRDPWVYHIGFVPMLGLILVPLAIFLQVRERRYEAVVISLFLSASCMLAFLLSIGPAGLIGWYLLKVPPYNWFRHSIKWMPFYQMFAVFAGFWSLNELIRVIPQRRVRGVAPVLLLTLCVANLCWYVAILRQSKALTDDEIPLPRPILGFDRSYRHVGFWPGGQLYGGGDMHGRLLCLNASSLWQLPTFGGYEPLVLKSNLRRVLNSWHPGCFLDYDSFRLPTLVAWGVRYIRVPSQDAAPVVEELAKRYPKYQIRDLGVDPNLRVNTLEVVNAPALIDGRWSKAGALTYSHNTVSATVESLKPDTLRLRWSNNPNFVVTIDGVRVESTEDSRGRITVPIRRAGRFHVQLEYQPRRLLLMYWLSLCVFLTAAGTSLIFWLRESCFSRR